MDRYEMRDLADCVVSWCFAFVAFALGLLVIAFIWMILTTPVHAAAEPAQLPTPANPTATCVDNSVRLSWDAVPGAQNYYVRLDYLPNNAGDLWLMASPPDFSIDGHASTNYSAPITPNADYAWWVHASDGIGLSSPASGRFNCPSRTNGAPVIVLIWSGPIELAWDPNTETTLVGYNVYRADAPGTYTAPLNPAPLTTTSYSDTSALVGKTYFYIVKAVMKDGSESSASNELGAKRSS